MLAIGGKRPKLTIWDTAGQERFGTLTSSYYRGAHVGEKGSKMMNRQPRYTITVGQICTFKSKYLSVYDVTRQETFTNLSELWAKEVELHSLNPDCIKILVGNKVDRDVERAITIEERMALAKEHKCLFYECSAKTKEKVQQCFKDLTLKILDRPSLAEQGS